MEINDWTPFAFVTPLSIYDVQLYLLNMVIFVLAGRISSCMRRPLIDYVFLESDWKLILNRGKVVDHFFVEPYTV